MCGIGDNRSLAWSSHHWLLHESSNDRWVGWLTPRFLGAAFLLHYVRLFRSEISPASSLPLIHGFRCSSICTCFRWESPLYLEEFGVGKYEIRELGPSAPLAVVERRIRIPQLVGSSVCHIPILSISFTYCLSHMQFGIWPELIGRFVCFYTGVTRLSHSPLPQDTAPGHESLPFQFFLATSQEC